MPSLVEGAAAPKAAAAEECATHPADVATSSGAEAYMLASSSRSCVGSSSDGSDSGRMSSCRELPHCGSSFVRRIIDDATSAPAPCAPASSAPASSARAPSASQQQPAASSRSERRNSRDAAAISAPAPSAGSARSERRSSREPAPAGVAPPRRKGARSSYETLETLAKSEAKRAGSSRRRAASYEDGSSSGRVGEKSAGGIGSGRGGASSEEQILSEAVQAAPDAAAWEADHAPTSPSLSPSSADTEMAVPAAALPSPVSLPPTRNERLLSPVPESPVLGEDGSATEDDETPSARLLPTAAAASDANAHMSSVGANSAAGGHNCASCASGEGDGGRGDGAGGGSSAEARRLRTKEMRAAVGQRVGTAIGLL